MISKKIIILSASVVIGLNVFAQDDMLALLDNGAKKTHDRVLTTFKEAKIINAQTTETCRAGTWAFNITHRFGNMGAASNGGGHTLYGLDNISDIRIGFDFGVTRDLTVGFGRCKAAELLDGYFKYRFLTQTTDNHVPFSLALYCDMSYTPQNAAVFYGGVNPKDSVFKQNDIHRFTYVSQLILARRFGSRFSVELLPTYTHRNFIVANINADNDAAETSDLLSIGGGFRFKFTKRIAFICDYFYTFSKYRTNNTANPYYMPLAVGFEIETGGHVFHMTFTNATGIVENYFIPNTTDTWSKGGYKFGFNISRVFNYNGKKTAHKE
ncbi:MAG: DUF5777 family beta-barrel protein [Bacteroidota bacterium]